jgi:hypothetical protein
MVVMGHSGTTGADSDPSRPGQDAPDNSWATGDNPKVDSIYQRLLATHPALKGHNNNLGRSGSTVDDLVNQTNAMLLLDPLPDVVIIQTIDNDIRCDGTDADNYQPFADTLDHVLSMINSHDVHAQVFFVDQWGSVRHYVDAIRHDKAAIAQNAGNGPCDTFTPSGRLRPQAMSYLQQVVNHYFERIVDVCARHRNCYTDHAALQQMTLTPADLTPDHNHLSVHGLHKMAAIAWSALPTAIRNRR